MARGPGLATAEKLALTCKELLKQPVEALGVADYRHGPLEAVAAGTSVLVIGSGRIAGGLNHTIHRDIRAGGGEAIWLQDGILHRNGEPLPSERSALPDAQGALLDTVPMQRLMYELARAIGHDASFRLTSKVTATE